MTYAEKELWFIDRYNSIPEKERSSYAFVTMKIKKFRTVSRLFGRETGDELLAMVNDIISSNLSDKEYMAMLNVNYFNLLLRFSSDDDLMDRIVALIRGIRDIPDDRFYRQVFAGAGAYRLPRHPFDFYTAQYNADLCRNESLHNSYRNGHFEVYGLTYDDPNEFFLDPQNKIQPAIDHGDIRLFLQPKVDLKTGKVTSAEALVRWIDPIKGMIPIKDFLPSLNATGLIRNVDLFLFGLVCKNIERWYKEYDKKIKISVNLAACSFGYAGFFEEYCEIFRNYKVPKDCIEFELLESIILNQVDRVQEVVTQLQSYGFACALDDFGSGFSSYSVLANSDLSVLKIDRSMFQNESNAKEKIVIKHILSSARELNMSTVAEGVETLGYVDYLKDLGCDYIQGFIFYKPMPVEEFEERFLINDERIKL